MGIQTQIRPTTVEPVPATRAQALRTMLSTAMAVDGYLETDPGRFAAHLQNCYLMPQADLLIAGTMCGRPLMTREFANVCEVGRHDGILVRLAGDPSSLVATFDVYQAGARTTHWAYRLWMCVPHGAAWLVPTAGEGVFVRLDPLGLEFCDAAPFVSDLDRARGLRHGSDYLAIATKGWF